jgi:hypothetical protein
MIIIKGQKDHVKIARWWDPRHVAIGFTLEDDDQNMIQAIVVKFPT